MLLCGFWKNNTKKCYDNKKKKNSVSIISGGSQPCAKNNVGVVWKNKEGLQTQTKYRKGKCTCPYLF